MKSAHAEKIRFIISGIYNTAFGYACFYLIFSQLGDYLHYLTALIFSYMISIFNNYLVLRYYVFRSNGPFWLELYRCYMTYSTILLFNALLLAVAREWFGADVLWAQFFLIIFVILASYLGNKYFSFGRR